MRSLFVALLCLISLAASAQTYQTSSGQCSPASESALVTSAITAPNSAAAFKMQGLAGTITPACSGIVLITISGTLISNDATQAATHGIKLEISYGTGTAPTTNATLTGTQAGVIYEYRDGATLAEADVFVPFSVTVVANLTVGSANWIDLAAEAVTTASDIGLSNVSIAALEQRVVP